MGTALSVTPADAYRKARPSGKPSTGSLAGRSSAKRFVPVVLRVANPVKIKDKMLFMGLFAPENDGNHKYLLPLLREQRKFIPIFIFLAFPGHVPSGFFIVEIDLYQLSLFQ